MSASCTSRVRLLVRITRGGRVGADGADLGDGHREIAEDLEQERLELLVRAVDLVDEEHRRLGGAALEGLKQGAPDQELLAEDVAGGGRLRLAPRLEQPDLEHLARVVPLVERRIDVQSLVALQPDELGAERAAERAAPLRSCPRPPRPRAGADDSARATGRPRSRDRGRRRSRGRRRRTGRRRYRGAESRTEGSLARRISEYRHPLTRSRAMPAGVRSVLIPRRGRGERRLRAFFAVGIKAKALARSLAARPRRCRRWRPMPAEKRCAGGGTILWKVGRRLGPKSSAPSRGPTARGGARAAEAMLVAAAMRRKHRRDTLLKLLGVQLDRPGILTRGGLDLGLLLFGRTQGGRASGRIMVCSWLGVGPNNWGHTNDLA